MMKIRIPQIVTVALLGGTTAWNGIATPQAQPSVTINPPTAGAAVITGTAQNIDTTKIKAVLYALTNQWYVQPLTAAPFSNIASNGTFTIGTNPWSVLVVILVDPANYTPQDVEITNPALDSGVIAWAQYPPGPAALLFDGYQWGIKLTGNQQGDQFAPGNNFFSNDPSVVSVQADGLHLADIQIGSLWQCAEVYLTKSLGDGAYTVQVSGDLSHLDLNSVAAPIFIYVNNIDAELDVEYSGTGGLIPSPYNAQFVAQPFTNPSNIVRYVQPATSQFTAQIEWHSDHVIFRTWNGWAAIPAASDVIYEWTYTGPDIPVAGQERVHINLWLNGNPPTSGIGDQMVIHTFDFELLGNGAINANPPNLSFVANYSGFAPSAQTISVGSIVSAVNFTATSSASWLTPQASTGVAPTGLNVTVNAGTMTPGTYNGIVTLASNVSTVAVPVTLTITEAGSPCDVLQNGTIAVTAVQQLIDEALGLANPANDLNHDGIVNVVDIQIVGDAVLGLGCLAH